MTQKIGIIGGSGLYNMDQLNVIEEIYETNAYGLPSAPIVHGTIEGIEADLYFLPRHGKGHILNPSEVPYQANILAMKSLGVDWIISVSAVGSLKEEIPPGDMVVIDQFIDRTKDRPATFFHDGIVGHVGFGDPVCPTLRQILLDGAREVTENVHDGGTYICRRGLPFQPVQNRTYTGLGGLV